MTGTSPTAVALGGWARAAGELASGATHPLPTGAGYTVLLLAHVASAVIGFGVICVTGLQALRAAGGPGSPKAGAVRRYFRPGPNWAARAIYGVPVFGFALLAASGGEFEASDTFVVVGLTLWLFAAVVAEVVVWPGERRIQQVVVRDWSETEAKTDAETEGDGAASPAPVLVEECTKVAYASGILAVVFVTAFVLMFAKP